MEVIVDDTQLSLAIGKKGQNVRLAAKLLGWQIDIKSEEEKRQEVESQMAALVVPGAPVSVLIDHGLAEDDGREADGGGRRHGGKAGRHDARGTGRDSRHRRRDGGEDSDSGERLLRPVRGAERAETPRRRKQPRSPRSEPAETGAAESAAS